MMHYRVTLEDVEACVNELQRQLDGKTPSPDPGESDRLFLVADALHAARPQNPGPSRRRWHTVAKDAASWAVRLSPQNQENRVSKMIFLAGLKLDHYHDYGGDLQESKDLVDQIDSVIKVSHKHFGEFLGCFAGANLFAYQSDESNQASALKRAIDKLRLAPQVVKADPELLQQFAVILLHHYHKACDPRDLEDAIQQLEHVRTMNTTARTWYHALSNLAESYGYMYELDPVKNGRFLDLAVKRGLEATKLVQNEGESADTAVTFGTLARALGDRFREKLERIDFVDAVKNGERAIQLSGSRPADKATWMNNLGLTYYTSFDDSGDIAHLQKAIELFDQAANLARKGSISELRSTNNLAEALSRRFEWTGETEALDLAISKCRGLTESAAWNSLERAKFFRVFASILLRRRKRSLKDEDLDEAVEKLAESIKSYPAGHSDLSFAHSLLCTTLAHRYEIKKNEKNEKDIQSAIEHGKMAIDKEIPGDPYAWTLFSDLALAYKSKWTVTKNDQDLDDAIIYSSKCLRGIPSSTPYQAYQLFNHALLLTERILAHRTTISSEIFQEPLTYLQNAVALPQGVPLARIKAARGAIKIFATFHDWESAISMGIEAIKLLPLVCGRYLSIQDQQQAISEMSGLAADVCSLLLQQKQPEKALLQLEIGRAVLLGYAMDYHEDLVSQSTDSQHLKTEFNELRRKLRIPHDVERSRMSEVEMRKRRAAEIDIEKCLEQIRQIKGHENFLQAPSLDEIKACSKDGPIILVNTTSIRSDAIVIASSSIRAVELPDFQPENAPEFDSECIPATCAADDPWERGVKVLSRRIPTQPKQESFIEWLWHTCVKVVLEELKTLCPLGGNGELPRIWWIGSGKAAGFPFHAAGDLSGTDQNALALMIPSYAPSVKALLFSRQRSRNRQTPNTQKLTVVTMKTTPGELPLPEVDRERKSILEICQKDYECSELRQPQVDAVLKALVDTDIIHFACHGLADSSDPSQSHLLLEKSNGKEVDKLTVSKILSLESLQQAWISYLSSCSTARTRGSRLPDEGLHTTAALQIAGFAHVIGGLWKVGDDTCVDMAQNFYASLLKRRNEPQQDRAVAAALRDAVLHIREQDSSSWRKCGAYVHFGA